MSGFLFYSHDGYGLGHVRRNARIASAVREQAGDSPVELVTGLSTRFDWLDRAGFRVTRVPPIVKDESGVYRPDGLTIEAAVARRAEAFAATVHRLDPDVIVVDRHPFGVLGELREGLDLARRRGSRVVLGLRDILDEAPTVRTELAGPRWSGVSELFDEALVYGGRAVCDHTAEYGLSLPARYVGWVTDPPHRGPRDPRLLLVAAGGGGDGSAVFHIAVEALWRQPAWRAIMVIGPYAPSSPVVPPALAGRVQIVRNAEGCGALMARAGAVLEMAGYNSTYEALSAGLRPILWPRRVPRLEQEIRATRLARLGLADVLPEAADEHNAAELLDGPRILPRLTLSEAGISLDGARSAARRLHELAGRRRKHTVGLRLASGAMGRALRPAASVAAAIVVAQVAGR